VAAVAGLIALPTQGGSVPLVVSRYPTTWACDKSRFKGLGSYHCLVPSPVAARTTQYQQFTARKRAVSFLCPKPKSAKRDPQIPDFRARRSKVYFSRSSISHLDAD
jgi:hypothetical protein